MITIYQKLKEFASYYGTGRRRGHTKAMLEGAKNSDCVVVCGDYYQCRNMAGVLEANTIDERTISVHAPHQLKSSDKPLVWDNYALYVLFTEAASEIERLESEIKDYAYALAPHRPHGWRPRSQRKPKD